MPTCIAIFLIVLTAVVGGWMSTTAWWDRMMVKIGDIILGKVE